MLTETAQAKIKALWHWICNSLLRLSAEKINTDKTRSRGVLKTASVDRMGNDEFHAPTSHTIDVKATRRPTGDLDSPIASCSSLLNEGRDTSSNNARAIKIASANRPIISDGTEMPIKKAKKNDGELWVLESKLDELNLIKFY